MSDTKLLHAEIAEARVELSKALGSATFVRSPRMGRLLEYLCEKTFAGLACEIKEYTIAVDLLGRPADFDPSENASARVEVHRLRKKLVEYYNTEGAERNIRIEIPSGSYVPVFGRVGSSLPLQLIEHADKAVKVLPESAPLPPPPARKRWPWKNARFAGRALAIAAVAGIIVLSLGLGARWHTKTPGAFLLAVASTGAADRVSTVAVPPGPVIRILAGRSEAYTDTLGRQWDKDQYFSGGTSFERPAKSLARAADPTIFSAGRTGLFTYDIPLPAGTYELRLYFAETQFGPGNPDGGGENSRLFMVSANNQRLLSAFDILSDAGGPNMADVRAFKDLGPASDGKLHLRFTRSVDQPLLNALELVPSPPHRMNPIRLTMQDHTFRDSRGRSWMPDQFGIGGRTIEHVGEIEGAKDSGLFGVERYGNFNYAIPVADGSYNLAVYMAETYFGAENPGGGGAGARVFEIYCNGLVLTREFDILSKVGPNRMFVFQSYGLRPNAQGKLNLSFLPVVNYPSIFAIEITSTP